MNVDFKRKSVEILECNEFHIFNLILEKLYAYEWDIIAKFVETRI